jgi:hypothetical protein
VCRPRDRVPKSLLLWSMRITGRKPGKADGFGAPEGCSPRSVMASGGDTTGIEERGMCIQG